MNADCIKLTSYFGERHRANGTFAANALIDLSAGTTSQPASCYAASRDSG